MQNSKTTNNKRATELSERLIKGAIALKNYAEKLSDSDWQKPVKGDGRTIGIVVHHVASAYPIEIELAKLLASGKPITEVTMDAVDQMNANHALENAATGKQETLELLQRNSKIAAEAVKTFTDTDLETAAAVSLNADAPLTAQFFIEDHALRHSFHHLERIKATIIQ